MVATRYAHYSFVALALTAVSLSVNAHEKDKMEVTGVRFPVACSAVAAKTIEQAVAQLHHMMYVNARELFNDAAETDPKCAIALWGISMTYIHPLWPDRPSPQILTLGGELMSQAVAIGGHDKRENAYISTTQAYFEVGGTRTEAERLLSFETAWKALYDSDPSDQEAKAFYALSQLATASRSDKTYAKQLVAGAMVEEVLDQLPDHPGGHHYLIHAYDFPGLAERALPVARSYGVVGPEVPHALHMMSHIYTRLGHWRESAEWNRRSAAAAWTLSEKIKAISVHYQHALDYLAYAYLQMGDDEQALEVVQALAALAPPFDTINRDAQAYALAATPARYVLERQDWVAAAELVPHTPSVFPWEPKHEAYVAQTHFARGIGLAHSGHFTEAMAEAEKLDEIRAEISLSSTYWATQVQIQSLGVKAWARFLNGEPDEGLSMMRDAATLESGTSKSPVTPGEIIPAAELLGDMLAQAQFKEEAIAAYESALKRSPRRLNSLYGAARVLEQMGDSDAADLYYTEIAVMVKQTSDRPVAREALRRAAGE